MECWRVDKRPDIITTAGLLADFTADTLAGAEVEGIEVVTVVDGVVRTNVFTDVVAVAGEGASAITFASWLL